MTVLSTNRSEYFEIYYACAIAGFIAQPINWRLAAEEISRILEDGTPKVLVCEDQFLDVWAEIKTKIPSSLIGLEIGSGSNGSYEALVNQTDEADRGQARCQDRRVFTLYKYPRRPH